MAMRRQRIKAAPLMGLSKRKKPAPTTVAAAAAKIDNIDDNADNSNEQPKSPEIALENRLELNTQSAPKADEALPLLHQSINENESAAADAENNESTTAANALQVAKAVAIEIPAEIKGTTNIAETEAIKHNDFVAIKNQSNDLATPVAVLPEKPFKLPPKVEFNRASSCNDENSANLDLLDNVFQQDFQKSASESQMTIASPSKQQQARPRIRATPVFGQRRNSSVPSSPSPHCEEHVTAAAAEFAMPLTTQRRERHYSQSSQSGNASHHTPHKYMPSFQGARIRTESGCSIFSDTSTARKDFVARFSKGVPDKTCFKMFDMIFYNPSNNPMDIKPNLGKIKAEQQQTDVDNDCIKSEKLNIKGEHDDKSAGMPVPQLKLNANGELILDEQTLVIETTAEQEARKTLANSSLIFLDENTGMNGFYRRQKRTKDWPNDETVKFYRCLQIIGTDFSLMCQLFPKRTRRDLKLKFKKEERVNPALINKALLHPKIFNIDDLKQQLEKEELEREEAARQWQEIKEKKKNLKVEKVHGSKGKRVLKNGDDVYENENVVLKKLGNRQHNKTPVVKVKRARKSNVNADAAAEKLSTVTDQEQQTLPDKKPKVLQLLTKQTNNKSSEVLQQSKHSEKVLPKAIPNSQEQNKPQLNEEQLRKREKKLAKKKYFKIYGKMMKLKIRREKKREEKRLFLNQMSSLELLDSSDTALRRLTKLPSIITISTEVLNTTDIKVEQPNNDVSSKYYLDEHSQQHYQPHYEQVNGAGLMRLENFASSSNQSVIHKNEACFEEFQDNSETAETAHSEQHEQAQQQQQQYHYFQNFASHNAANAFDNSQYFGQAADQQQSLQQAMHYQQHVAAAVQSLENKTFFNMDDGSLMQVPINYSMQSQYNAAAAAAAQQQYEDESMSRHSMASDFVQHAANVPNAYYSSSASSHTISPPTVQIPSPSPPQTMDSMHSPGQLYIDEADYEAEYADIDKKCSDMHIIELSNHSSSAHDAIEQPHNEDNYAEDDNSMSEHDIEQILNELAEGSLVLVSTLDPLNSDKVLNEIYMIKDKQTGELCDKPLQVPEPIVQCIINAMS